ncbi:hypothetical protein T492DRAFT_39924 [Pavlovales sp. CCMP2436]|nr:hypothetical protein T492DRAFT_39924 [Pavlovales sp. CCMP2436]
MIDDISYTNIHEFNCCCYRYNRARSDVPPATSGLAGVKRYNAQSTYHNQTVLLIITICSICCFHSHRARSDVPPTTSGLARVRTPLPKATRVLPVSGLLVAPISSRRIELKVKYKVLGAPILITLIISAGSWYSCEFNSFTSVCSRRVSCSLLLLWYDSS